MKIGVNNKYFRWGLTVFLTFAACILVVYVIFFNKNLHSGIQTVFKFLMPINLGMVTAYLLAPVLNFIEYKILFPILKKVKFKSEKKKTKLVRVISVCLSCLFFFVIIYSLIAMFLSQIIPNVVEIANNFDIYVDNITNWVNGFLSGDVELGKTINGFLERYSEEIEKWINDTVISKSTTVLGVVTQSIFSSIKGLWNFIIGFIISIYMLASKEKFAAQAKKITYALFQNNTANVIINNFRFTHKTFVGFLGGKIIDSIIVGIICFVGTYIMKTPYFVLVSLIVGVTNIIPFFGPYLGAIPSAILIFMVDPMHPLNVLYFLIFILILQQIDGNVIGPKILGDSTGLSGFWVIFAITFFGGIFGIAGMIIGVPLFAVIFAAIKSLLDTKLKRKNLNTETDFYVNVGCIDSNGVHEYVPYYTIKRKDRSSKVKFGDRFISNNDENVISGSLNRKPASIVSDDDKEDEIKIFDDETGKGKKE